KGERDGMGARTRTSFSALHKVARAGRPRLHCYRRYRNARTQRCRREDAMILITGASGNVGSEVLKQAAAAGLKIRATFQIPDKASKAPTGVEAVIMDY